MATGYTFNVVDGQITTLSDFAMQCARAFGLLIDMRDAPSNAPIPERLEPYTDYYDQRIEESLKLLGDIQAMTAQQAEVAADETYLRKMEERDTYLADQKAAAVRLNDMLTQVRAWTPPTTDHAGLKDFMIQQLTVSMPGEYAPPLPERLDGAAWRKKEIERLSDEIVRARENRNEKIARTEKRNAWLQALRSSLPTPESRP